PVLSSLESLQRAQLNLLLARRQLLSYRIQLCRALGGTWTQSLEEPESESLRQPERGGESS
ncbi:MAG: RND transporter, partial [Myxococcota bacterium]